MESAIDRVKETDNDVNTQNRARKMQANDWKHLKDIPVFGDPLGGKDDDNIRFYFENVDGFSIDTKNHPGKNKKLNYLTNLLQRLEVDVFRAVETQTN